MQSGFTMIELMVCIAILGLLMLVGMPLSQEWLNTSKVKQSSSQLKQAMAIAKAKALQNPSASTGSNPAAVLVVMNSESNSDICVYKGQPGTLDCSSTPDWKSRMPVAVSINSATSSQCIAIDNSGMPISATVDSTACSTSLAYSISKGDSSDTGTLN